MSAQASPGTQPDLARRHVRAGWGLLLLFATLGLGLEALHAVKLGFYLDVGNEMRRLMWTLAHAHGVLLAVVHIAFGVCAATGLVVATSAISRLLFAAIVLLPGGFFLGGVATFGGDPSPGAWLSPLGGLCLLAALFLTARSAGRAS